MGKKVVHFEIVGKDGKKLQNFYSKLFDWKIDANNSMNYGQVSAADAGLGGGIAPAQPEEANRVTVYVEVDDLNGFLKTAEGLGGRTIMPPTDVPGGPSIAMFTDPEGNVAGLIKAGSTR